MPVAPSHFSKAREDNRSKNRLFRVTDESAEGRTSLLIAEGGGRKTSLGFPAAGNVRASRRCTVSASSSSPDLLNDYALTLQITGPMSYNCICGGGRLVFRV